MKDIYAEPFISSWPTPLSFKDIKECFRNTKPFRKRVQIKISSGEKTNFQKDKEYNTNIIKAFWDVFFSPVSFNA